MADVVTFDAPNLRIIEISAAGDNELTVQEIYSEWKDWCRVGDNIKHPRAFRYVGGDPISDTLDLGVTYFLMNGWKIRPAELSHKLTVVGNLYTDPAGESAFVPTQGSYVVNVETRVSNLVDSTVADAAQIEADAALARKLLQNKMITDPSTGELIVYDDDGTELLRGDLFEDAAGVTPYQGQGAERRERLT